MYNSWDTFYSYEISLHLEKTELGLNNSYESRKCRITKSFLRNAARKSANADFVEFYAEGRFLLRNTDWMIKIMHARDARIIRVDKEMQNQNTDVVFTFKSTTRCSQDSYSRPVYNTISNMLHKHEINAWCNCTEKCSLVEDCELVLAEWPLVNTQTKKTWMNYLSLKRS